MAMDLLASSRESDDSQAYIPFLPDDVALECLLRVSPRSHSFLHNVSRKWRNLVNSTEFYEHRRKEGATHQYLCLLQAAPQSNTQQHPVYYVSIFDTSKPRHEWERLPPIPEFDHLGLPLFCRLASAPGMLVVLGGWHPTTWETLNSVYVFSFTSWKWHRGADMPTTRSFFACSTIKRLRDSSNMDQNSRSHHIVVAGGHDHTKSALASADMYNTMTNSWQSLPQMTTARDECMGVSIAGNFLAIGGYHTSTSHSKFVSSGDIYDLDNNTWAPLPDMCSESASNAVATSQGIFAFHGRELVSYCEEESKWEVVDTLPAGKDGISAVAGAAGFGWGISMTGPCNDDEEQHRSLVYRLASARGSGRARRGAWEALPVDGDFVGMTVASCGVEF